MKSYVYFFLLCASLCFGQSLKDKIEGAREGDYIVIEAGKTITLLSIRANTETSLVLEEISVPTKNLTTIPTSWASWMKAKAPGHTSWSMTEIDWETGQILECYSFSRSSWVRLSQKESLFATLLLLPMQRISPENQRKIGPAPIDGETDTRKIWTPPFIVQGKKMENVSFDAFKVTWPGDGSELAGKDVSLYFDRENRSLLPFWIQVDTSHLTAAMRSIDSGKNLPPIYRTIPRRVPEFIGQPHLTSVGLSLSLKSPKYYSQFELFAVDVTSRTKQIIPVAHTLISQNQELLTLHVTHAELAAQLQENHRYNWLLIPDGFNESYTESNQPILWTHEHCVKKFQEIP